MGQLQLRAEVHGERLLQARELFFEQGDHPDGLVDPLILRSWERCRRFGVGDPHLTDVTSTMDRVALKTEQERNRFLLTQSRPIMEHVFEQIRETGSMVILADANGLLLETVGDPDFVSRADRVSLMAGASWDENLRGTNAHHQCETVFKAFGRALRMAVTPDPRQAGVVPSTKGAL